MNSPLRNDPGCTRCKLYQTTNRVCVLGIGPKQSDVMIVGEAPGGNEERTGIPFSGKAGQLLTELLEENGLDRDDIFVCNAVSCRPPENRTPTKGEINACKKWLDYQISMVKPKYVLLLGNVPLQSVTGSAGITKRRGRPFEKDGVIFLPAFHPAFILRDPSHEDTFAGDIRLFKDIINFGGIPEERELSYRSVLTEDDFRDMLKDLSGTVAFDIETNQLYPWRHQLVDKKTKRMSPGPTPKIVSMGFATSRTQWCLPVHHRESPWSKGDLETMVERIAERLEDCMLVTHNGKFDLLWVLVHFGVQLENSFDTMLAHYILDENDRHGLKYLAMKFLGAPDWEIDVNEKQGEAPWHRHAKYLAHDVYFTRKLRFLFGKLLNKDQEVRQVFRQILMPCSNLFVEVEYEGVCVNYDKFEEAETFLRDQYNTALADLKKWEPEFVLDAKGRKQEFNWGSSKQLGWLLFEELGIKPLDLTKTGAPSCSESVIKRIDHPCTGSLLKFREAKQQLSFFIDGWKPYLHKKEDGQYYLHPSFKLHGTVTGRLSCENPNLQQVPRDPRIRSLITAKPGWTLIEADLSQIELRIAAELANERAMIEAFRTGVDVHWLTATRELERGGGGDQRRLINETAGMFLMSIGLSPDGSGAKILQDLWRKDKKRELEAQLLQSIFAARQVQETGGGQRRKSVGGGQSLMVGWIEDLATSLSEEAVRALREYAVHLSSSQGRKPKELGSIKFSDAMSILSRIGPSVAEQLHKEWKELRKKAKAVNFGFLYGMWWKKFKIYARDNYGVNVTDEQAQASREAFFDLYGDLPEWHNRQRRYARKFGYVRSLSGRKRRLPDARMEGSDPFTKAKRQEAERQAINSPVQSFANDINLMAAIQLRKEFGRRVVRIVGTVHDAILCVVRNDYVPKVYKRLLEIMSGPDMFEDFDIELSVPIEAEAKIGPWSSGISLEEWEERYVKGKDEESRREVKGSRRGRRAERV